MNKKGRPRKKKIIQQHPGIDTFSPENIAANTEKVILSLEEYETIRLYDHQGLDQKTAAGMMGISQQSFSLILRKARRKVSDALVNAKCVKISGGDFINKRSADVIRRIRGLLN